MKIFTGNANDLPARQWDDKGKTFDEDVYVNTVAGFRVLATAGEQTTSEYYAAVMAGCDKGGKPAPKENKGDKSATETKGK